MSGVVPKMSKTIREIYHYLILSFLVIPFGIFLGYFSSTLTPFMNWIQTGNWFLKSISYLILWFWYSIIVGILFVISDLILHKLYEI